MKKILAGCLAMLCVMSAAEASVILEEHVLQKGIFRKSNCKPDTSYPNYDACQCKADIRYPEIKGLKNFQLQESLNAEFRSGAEQVKCKGIADNKTVWPTSDKYDAKQKRPLFISFRYFIGFQSSSVMGIEVGGSQYGRYPFYLVSDDIILDLEREKRLRLADLFSSESIPAVNQLIYETLSSHNDADSNAFAYDAPPRVFHKQMEKYKGRFIHDGKCEGCTLHLSQWGIIVKFDYGAITPDGVGIVIPGRYIAVPAIANMKVVPRHEYLGFFLQRKVSI